MDIDTIKAALGNLAATPTHDPLERVLTFCGEVATPLGSAYVAFNSVGVVFLRLASLYDNDLELFCSNYRTQWWRPIAIADKVPKKIASALADPARSKLPLDLSNLSDFERAVLTAAAQIPYGEIRPYNWLAQEVGHQGAARAAGSALAKNPLPMIIPCHRVVTAAGSLGNYIFGVPAKELLLRSEDVNLAEIGDLAQRGVRFIGSTTTRVVCYPSCHQARRIKAPHKVTFATLGIALTAGFRPCQRCRPV